MPSTSATAHKLWASTIRETTCGTRSAQQLAVLADGNIAVLDGDSGRLVLFDDQLDGGTP